MAISNNHATRVGFHRAESSPRDANAHADATRSLSKVGSQGADSVGDPWVGTTVGKYLIEAVIASGGMGTVYKAKQTLPVQRSVALKMIRIGMADTPMIERFHRERQTLALMDHPDIARVYEADSTVNGNPYFVMEYCDGLPIDEYCRENKLGLRARIELVIRIARALSRAHAHGVIHRDLKPGNILVSDCEGRPNLKVIDFGIAKLDESRIGVDLKGNDATRLGEMIGTPAYMSPEQAAGCTIDCRTDVFAIGAILYKLLTDTTPIVWPDNADSSLADIISTIQAFDPTAPSGRFINLDTVKKLDWCDQVGGCRPNQWTRNLKRDLDWIALRAIEPNRMERYATADDFADDLDRYLRNETVVAVAPSWRYRCRKLYQRRRALVLATAAVSVTVVLSASLFGYSWVCRLQKRQSEIASTTTHVEHLLQEAETDRTSAALGGPNSQAFFYKAETAVAKAESMLDLFPELDELRNRQRSANSRIALDNQAYRMAELLRNASDNGVCQEIGVAGDSFGRQAVRDAIAKAFSTVSIAVAETNPAHAAEKILQLPLSVREAIIESLDFMMTENPVGAGLFLSQRGGKLTVADTVYGGGSASRGQIRIGDRLLGIGTVELLDSFPSDEIGIEAYRLLAGKPGSKVTIRYARGPGEENKCDVVCGGVDALWAYHVLAGVDPDPWRSELRTAIVQCDLKTIRKLASTSLEEQNTSGTVATGVATATGAIQLANALVLFDRSNDSVRFMESVQKRHPGNFWLHQLLGEALVTSNTPPRPEASIRYLTAAVALRPGSAGAHWSMARSLEMLGDFENAREQKKRAEELLGRHRSSATILVPRAGVNDEKGSVVSLESARVPLQPLELQCLELARNGKRIEAMKLIAEKEASGLEGNLGRRAKGMVLAESGDHVGAKVIFTQLVRKNPDDCVSRFFFAQVLHQLGEDPQAIEQCEASLRSNPDFAPAIDLLNILLVR